MPRYSAGWNMPGYLPESDPAEFESFDEAKRYIIDEVLEQADQVDDEDLAETMTIEAEDINLESGEFVYGPYDGYVYWVTETED